jgi:protein phosphatase
MRVHHETGPFDIIGDLHGCCDELEQLLLQLGYRVTETRAGRDLASGPVYKHPDKRRAVFLGDLVDRGPRILDTLRLVFNMVQAGSAFCVTGNHDEKLYRKLQGRNVQIKHGLETTMAELDALPAKTRMRFDEGLKSFFKNLPHHLVLDDGHLVIAHAGLKEELHGQASGHAKSFALYGETTGLKDEYGLPIRGNWPEKYEGNALVVFGHTPVADPLWINNTVDIDTGCVFGGKLTALQYPEQGTVSVAAREIYYESAKPFPRAVEIADELRQEVYPTS